MLKALKLHSYYTIVTQKLHNSYTVLSLSYTIITQELHNSYTNITQIRLTTVYCVCRIAFIVKRVIKEVGLDIMETLKINLVSTSTKTNKAAQMRKIMPLIEERINSGLSHQEIVEILNKSGLEISLITFRRNLYRYRDKQKEIGAINPVVNNLDGNPQNINTENKAPAKFESEAEQENILPVEVKEEEEIKQEIKQENNSGSYEDVTQYLDSHNRNSTAKRYTSRRSNPLRKK